MCRLKGYGFLGLFGLKTGVHFAHLGLKSGMVFEVTTRAYKRIYRFNSKWTRKKLRNMRIRNAREESFSFRSNLSNYDVISAWRPGLKTGMDFRG